MSSKDVQTIGSSIHKKSRFYDALNLLVSIVDQRMLAGRGIVTCDYASSPLASQLQHTDSNTNQLLCEKKTQDAFVKQYYYERKQSSK
jgi:hypothetical protein